MLKNRFAVLASDDERTEDEPTFDNIAQEPTEDEPTFDNIAELIDSTWLQSLFEEHQGKEGWSFKLEVRSGGRCVASERAKDAISMKWHGKGLQYNKRTKRWSCDSCVGGGATI
jgi:hypothetical protein